MEKDIPSKRDQCHFPTSYKIDFKRKQARKDKDKDPVKEGRHLTLNIHTPNSGIHNSIKSILWDLKIQINSNSAMTGDFRVSFSPIDRSSEQNLNREV